MTYKITVVDDNNIPIPGASVAIIDSNGYGNVVLTAGVDGVIVIDTSTEKLDVPNLSGFTLVVTAVGYNAVGPTDATEFVYPAKVVLTKQNNAALIAVGIGALLLGGALLLDKKNKKVSGVSMDEIKPWLPLVGVAIIGGIVYYKVFGDSAETAAYNQTIDTAIQSAGPTALSDVQIAVIADTLENDLNKSSISNDTEDAIAQLSKLRNVADVYALIKAFGSRWQFFFGVPRGKSTLQQFLTGELSADELATVNRNFAASGINFTF